MSGLDSVQLYFLKGLMRGIIFLDVAGDSDGYFKLNPACCIRSRRYNRQSREESSDTATFPLACPSSLLFHLAHL